MTDNIAATDAVGYEEFFLTDLADDDLVTQMHDDLYDGLKEEIEEGTNILLDRGWTAEAVLNKALVEGMRIVGVDFRDGILFVPEVLLTTTMPYMKVVIDQMIARGIRDDYIVLVGGAPLTEEFAANIGADGYCRDAAQAADMAPKLINDRREATCA